MQVTAELKAVCFFVPMQYMVSGNIGINKVKGYIARFGRYNLPNRAILCILLKNRVNYTQMEILLLNRLLSFYSINRKNMLCLM